MHGSTVSTRFVLGDFGEDKHTLWLRPVKRLGKTAVGECLCMTRYFVLMHWAASCDQNLIVCFYETIELSVLDLYLPASLSAFLKCIQDFKILL